MSILGHRQAARDVPSRELVEFVLRAERRGFCRWRVATALGISTGGLAGIEHAEPTTDPAEVDQQQRPAR